MNSPISGLCFVGLCFVGLVSMTLLSTPSVLAQTGMTVTHSDEAYGSYATHNTYGESVENLDAYLHTNPAVPSPVLVEIHGGGWSKGNKSDFSAYFPNASNLGAIEKAYLNGMAVVSLNYPLTEIPVEDNGAMNPDFPGNIFPVPEIAVQNAIQFIRKSAATWKIDPDRIFVLGGSAGGHLGAWTAMNKDARDPAETDPAELSYYSSRVAGVVMCWAPSYLSKHHLEGQRRRPALWHHFGHDDELDYLANIRDSDTYPASPGWLVTNAGDTQAERDAIALLNAKVPILGVYPVTDPATAASCSTAFTAPTTDAHGYVFGLWMEEAFRTSFLPMGFTVDCTGPANPDWRDFTFELFQFGPSVAQKDAAGTAVADWLDDRSSAMTARLVPDPLPGISPLYLGWHINLANQTAASFLAAQASDPSRNHIDVSFFVDNNPSTTVSLSYETLVQMETSGQADIDIADNAISISLTSPVSTLFPGYTTVTSSVEVKRLGSTDVVESGTYTP